MEGFLKRIHDALGYLSQSRGFRAFAAAYLFTAITYRILLASFVVLSENAPLGVAQSPATALQIGSGWGQDALLLMGIAFVLLTALCFFPRFLVHKNLGRSVAFLGALFMLWNAFVLASTVHLLFVMNSAFTYSIFIESLTILRVDAFLSLLHWYDAVALLLPFVLYLFLLNTRMAWQISKNVFLGFTLVSVCLFLVAAFWSRARLPEEVFFNPQVYFLRDVKRSFSLADSLSFEKTQQSAKMALQGPDFGAIEPTSKRVTRSRQKANVVFILLESTGSEYIFDTTKYADGKMPMPYLYSLSKKSLYFAKHFASNNSSPRSIFSIFSGLYESPEIRFFSMERKLNVPHLVDFLGKDYARFLVTPADLNWYFPKAWFNNRGFRELEDFGKLKFIREYKAGPTAVRDEMKTVDYFIKRLKSEKKPYMAVYYTFVGHWPYPDLGKEHRLIEPHSSRDRYINNLFTQDKLVERIVRALEDAHQMENTVLVVVGDHGEAFYQHPGNRVHSGASFNENIMAPLLIYSPKLIAPRTIDSPSVHADIVPTLLEVLGVAFNPTQFQGASALTGEFAREFIFTFGNENTLTAVSRASKKMQLLRTVGRCQAFDLMKDPKEQNALGCNPKSAEFKALEAFRKLQPGLLKGYNELCLNKACP